MRFLAMQLVPVVFAASALASNPSPVKNFGYECFVDKCRVVGVLCRNPNGQEGGPWNPGCAFHTVHVDECPVIPTLNVYDAEFRLEGSTVTLSGKEHSDDGDHVLRHERSATLRMLGFAGEEAVLAAALEVRGTGSRSIQLTGHCRLEELSDGL